MIDLVARLNEQRQKAYLEAIKAHSELQKARKDYEKAVMEAHRLGVANTAMAQGFGISETSVRLFIKRRKEAK